MDNDDTIESTTGYLNAKDAAALDVELMETPGFSLEQLMELAGLSVAEAVYSAYPPTTISDTNNTNTKTNNNKVLLVCGPGNNGGDGLVAARHLVHFGYEKVTVVYPKASGKEHFINLVQQCSDVEITMCDEMPANWQEEYSVLVDAIFGFSFRGEPREPFKSILSDMIQFQEEVPIVSVDVPSGWDVDRGDVAGLGLMPNVLVSLTTPKPSSRDFPGRHFVGGRFLPPRLASKYGIRMPPYPGVSQVMEVTESSSVIDDNDIDGNEDTTALSSSKEKTPEEGVKQQLAKTTKGAAAVKSGDDDWRVEYAKYLAEKEAVIAVGNGDLLSADPSYGKHSKAIHLDPPPGTEEWAVQYDQYLLEKYEEEQKAKESKKQ